MKDERVVTLLGRTVPVKQIKELDEKLSKELEVGECPLCVLFDPSGTVVFRTQGHREAGEFVRLLSSALEYTERKKIPESN